MFSLAPFLRGEGRGEGLYPRVISSRDLYPLTRIASAMQSDLSPQAGRGEKSRAYFAFFALAFLAFAAFFAGFSFSGFSAFTSTGVLAASRMARA
ncbi:hypothetical protein V1280_007838 [Bradyrhizobium sp. AZCC 2230]